MGAVGGTLLECNCGRNACCSENKKSTEAKETSAELTTNRYSWKPAEAQRKAEAEFSKAISQERWLEEDGDDKHESIPQWAPAPEVGATSAADMSRSEPEVAETPDAALPASAVPYDALPAHPTTYSDSSDGPPLPDACEFTVVLRKPDPNEPLGLGLRRCDQPQQIVIKKTGGQALKEWHDANPTKRVRVGDEIVAANGVSGNIVDIIKMLQSSVEIEMTLRRQVRVTVDVTKLESIGLVLQPDGEVKRVTDGVVKSWNQKCPPNSEILEGDRLAEVNGMPTDSVNLQEKLSSVRDGDQLRLVFTRPLVK